MKRMTLLIVTFLSMLSVTKAQSSTCQQCSECEALSAKAARNAFCYVEIRDEPPKLYVGDPFPRD
jgi:hypothetical protein